MTGNKLCACVSSFSVNRDECWYWHVPSVFFVILFFVVVVVVVLAATTPAALLDLTIFNR